jgi:hypothetical protein
VIDLKNTEILWPSGLAPLMLNEYDKEPFSIWWERNKTQLQNLPKDVCEQWIYRHWEETEYKFIPLESLSCQLDEWNTDRIVQSIGIWDEALIVDEGHTYCSPIFDKEEVFLESEREPRYTLDKTGTWNIPIVVLHSEDGFITFRGKRQDIHYWLIEGHKRIRYLNVLRYFHQNNQIHRIYILSLSNQK